MSVNSFLAASLLIATTEEGKRRASRFPAGTHALGISNVSMLYQYAGVPPLAYGSPASKVLSSLVRGTGFNRLPNNGYGGPIPRQYWTEADGEYPTNVITSNFHPPSLQDMLEEFIKVNYQAIDHCVQHVYDFMVTANADVLTKGRQTWDPINKRSVPSAQAFREMDSLFRSNLSKDNGYTIMHFLNSFNKMLSLGKLEYITREEGVSRRNVRDEETGMIVVEEKRVLRRVKKRLVGDAAREKMMEFATTFCAYLKTKERGKLERRAIASANPIMRMYLLLIEEFHLKLGKMIDGSTISIGGEEKRQKMVNTMSSLSFLGGENSILQGTEDATKWNECLAPAAFAQMHDAFFDPEIRERLNLPPLPKDAPVLRKVFSTAMYLLSNKKIYLGRGTMAVNERGQAGTHGWEERDVPLMNDVMRELYEQYKDHIVDDYAKAPYGMLMGMMNAASTTLGLLPTRWKLKSCWDRRTVRSSDDSMTAFAGTSDKELVQNIMQYYRNLKLVGINQSDKKGRLFRWNYGEYTSNYQDGDFVSQYGVETAALRPQGSNPPDDFNSGAIQTATALRNCSMNFIGAQMRLALVTSNVRRLWKVRLEPNKREGVRGQVLALSDGGFSPWRWSNCWLSEMALKWHIANEGPERDYLNIIMNPHNPFSSEVTEKTTYSVDLGTLIEVAEEIPRTIFHVVKRSNATKRALMKDSDDAVQRCAQTVVDLFETINPACLITNPTGTSTFAEFSAGVIASSHAALTSCDVEFTPAEVELINKAKRRLLAQDSSDEDMDEPEFHDDF